jgi:5-hydroxyisourate hydrolase
MLSTMTATLTATIHDLVHDRPADGVRVQLYWSDTHGDVLLKSGATNRHGTTDAPLLDPTKMSAGRYRLVLHIGDYLDENGVESPRSFIDILPLAFVIEDASQPLHLNIRITPSSYSVERE